MKNFYINFNLEGGLGVTFLECSRERWYPLHFMIHIAVMP